MACGWTMWNKKKWGRTLLTFRGVMDVWNRKNRGKPKCKRTGTPNKQKLHYVENFEKRSDWIISCKIKLQRKTPLQIIQVYETQCPNMRPRQQNSRAVLCRTWKSYKWKWAGHIARLKDNRWTKRCTEWQPRRGKRSRGWPSRRWQDDITEKEGTTWIRKATDKRQWKTLMEGYILQWMDKA